MVWYRTGTISVDQNSSTVIGTGTDFAGDVVVGDMWVGPDNLPYEITNVASATVLSIDPPYKSADASGAAYYVVPTGNWDRELVNQVKQMILDIGEGQTSANLQALAALVGVAGQVPVFTGQGTMELLALGTAAKAELTESNYDDTPGRVLKVGDFGIGEENQTDTTLGRLLSVGDFGVGTNAAPVISDFTADLQSGFYRANASGNANATPNGPPGSGSGTLSVVVLPGDGDASSNGFVALGQAAGVWLGTKSELGALTWLFLDGQDDSKLPLSGGTLTGVLNEAPIVTLASAATMAIGVADGNTINVTGTTTIIGFDSVDAGARRTLIFADALTVTHDDTALILPGGVDITTAPGDSAEFISLGSGNWLCLRAGSASAGDSGGAFTPSFATVAASEGVSTAHNVVTWMTFDTILSNANGMADLDVSGEYLTIPEDGLYLVYISGDFAGSTSYGSGSIANLRITEVDTSITILLAAAPFSTTGGAANQMSASAVVWLEAGAKYQAGFFQNTGKTVLARGTDNYSARLGMVRVG